MLFIGLREVSRCRTTGDGIIVTRCHHNCVHHLPEICDILDATLHHIPSNVCWQNVRVKRCPRAYKCRSVSYTRQKGKLLTSMLLALAIDEVTGLKRSAIRVRANFICDFHTFYYQSWHLIVLVSSNKSNLFFSHYCKCKIIDHVLNTLLKVRSMQELISLRYEAGALF